MENEVRLIDANALHKMLEEAQDGTRRIYFSLVDYGDKDVCKGELGTYARVKRMVEEAPTIDAVPVVRCKECKNWDATECVNGKCWCRTQGEYRGGDWYCADGEKQV